MENITCVPVCLDLGPLNTGLKYMQTAHKVVRSDKHVAIYALFSISCSVLPKIAQKHTAIYVPFSKLNLEEKLVDILTFCTTLPKIFHYDALNTF